MAQLGDGFDIRETYAAQNAALARIWDDPDLDDYADYDNCLKASLGLS